MLNLGEPRVGFGSQSVAHEIRSFSMAGEVQIEAAGRVALHVLLEAANPADVRIVLVSDGQMASRLSMKGIERSPKAVRCETVMDSRISFLGLLAVIVSISDGREVGSRRRRRPAVQR